MRSPSSGASAPPFPPGPRRLRPRPRRSGLLLLIPLLWACDDGTEPTVVGSIIIDPVTPYLVVGGSVQLSVRVLSTTGSLLPGHPVTWTTSADAVAQVSPGGRVTAMGGGTATIRASSDGKSDDVSFTVETGPCEAATAGSIAVGETRTGRIDADDCSLYDVRAEGWTLALASARDVQVVLRAPFSGDLLLTTPQLDPVLGSRPHPDGVQLVGNLPAGSYIVWVGSYEAESPDDYQLTVSEASLCSASTVEGAIALGGNAAGTLEADDCVFLDGGAAVGYRLELGDTTGVRIDLTSAAFDPVVVVTDLDVNVLFWDDDGGEGANSRIERYLHPGEYIVWVTGIDADGTGAYQLSVAEAEIALCPVAGDVVPGQPATGSLSTGDCVGERGYADPWRLVLAAQTTVGIDLTSTDFDTFLVIEDRHGIAIAFDDDAGGDLDSRIQRTLPAGEYRIVATSYGYGETGAYRLVVTELGTTGSLRAPASPEGAPWLKRHGKG